jgi:hypothetical protein
MAAENEHETKINKPWEIWAYEKCRECQHDRYYHLLDYGPSGYKDELRATMGNCNRIVKDSRGQIQTICSCKEFFPPDNLDYIEILAKKKGLFPDSD